MGWDKVGSGLVLVFVIGDVVVVKVVIDVGVNVVGRIGEVVSV